MSTSKFELSSYLKMNKIKQQSIADAINKSLSTTNRKILGKIHFTLEEVQIIHTEFGVPVSIFFK